MSLCVVMPMAHDLRILQDWLVSTTFGTLQSSDSAIFKVFFARDVVNGLLTLHQSGVVHGDLKPQNIPAFNECARCPRLKDSDFSHSIIVEDYKEVPPTPCLDTLEPVHSSSQRSASRTRW